MKSDYSVLHRLVLLYKLYLKKKINKNSIFNEHSLIYKLVINFIQFALNTDGYIFINKFNNFIKTNVQYFQSLGKPLF